MQISFSGFWRSVNLSLQACLYVCVCVRAQIYHVVGFNCGFIRQSARGGRGEWRLTDASAIASQTLFS